MRAPPGVQKTAERRISGSPGMQASPKKVTNSVKRQKYFCSCISICILILPSPQKIKSLILLFLVGHFQMNFHIKIVKMHRNVNTLSLPSPYSKNKGYITDFL